jgi:hypothetical protein
MKAVRALLLILAIFVSAYAGEMECGRSGNMPTDKAGVMETDKTSAMHPVTEIALYLLQSVLTPF